MRWRPFALEAAAWCVVRCLVRTYYCSAQGFTALTGTRIVSVEYYTRETIAEQMPPACCARPAWTEDETANKKSGVISYVSTLPAFLPRCGMARGM